MDTSEQYIKMSDCEEIQEVYKEFDLTKFPNYVYDKVTERASIIFWTPNRLKEMIGNKGNVLIVSIESNREKNQYVPEYEGDFHNSIIWLPRQDQLQEMVFANCLPEEMLDELSSVTRKHMDSPMEDYFCQFTSMEQLWLAFCMSEKYGETWNGDSWIRE